MRFAVVTLLWLITTAALAAAVPAVWLQANLIDAGGYTRLARQAAAEPALQDAVADQLVAQAMRLFREHRFEMAPSAVRAVAVDYTTGPAFPAQFADTNRGLHDWLLADDRTDTWLINVAPMLRDKAFESLFSEYNVSVPATLSIPVTWTYPDRLGMAARWASWLAIGASLLAVGFGCLTFAAARRRGRVLAGLGVSALLVGAAGWAGIEVGRGHLDDALGRATPDVRQIAGVLADSVEQSMHQWLDVTLVGGGLLVGCGVLAAMLGGLLRS